MDSVRSEEPPSLSVSITVLSLQSGNRFGEITKSVLASALCTLNAIGNERASWGGGGGGGRGGGGGGGGVYARRGTGTFMALR